MKSKGKYEMVANKIIKCRTCLGPLDPSSRTDITKEFVLGKTVKEVLLVFISQMVTSSMVGDFICCHCTTQVRNFAKYIQNFIEVEKSIIEDNLKNQKQSANDHVNSNLQNVPVNIIYVIPAVSQNGTQNGGKPFQPIQLQPVPINYLLASTANTSLNVGKSVSPLGQRGTPNSSLSQKLILPRIELQEQHKKEGKNDKLPLKEKIKRAEEFQEKKNSDLSESVGNNICRTCGDIFTSDEYSAVKCLKCTSGEQVIEVISSDDTRSNTVSNDGSDDDEAIEKDPIILIKEAEEPKLHHLLRGKFCDKIISISEKSKQIDTLKSDVLDGTTKIVNHGPTFSTEKKRILFLGSSTTECLECRALLKHPLALKHHFAQAHSQISSEEDDGDEDDLIFNPVKKKTFDCPFCETKVITAMQLVEHLHKMHTVENPFKCEKCNKTFKKRDQYLEHTKKFEKSSDCSLRRCRFCMKMFAKEEYQAHLMNHKEIICDKCGRSFLSIHHFRNHYVTHRVDCPKPQGSKYEEAHLCPICGKLLSNPRNMRMHIAIHGDRSRDYICHKCPKTFLTKHTLNHHLGTAHAEKKYECPICHIKVKTSSALSSHHNLKHSKSYSHVCKICSQGFSRGDYYRRHLTSHAYQGQTARRQGKKKYNYSVRIGSKAVKCKYCSKLFKNVYMLRTHALSHVKSMRFKCKFCNMTFANTGTRYRHQKRHADPNFDLSCTVCWKRMNSKKELEAHIAKHNDSKKYRCSECNNLFASKYLLKHHMSEQHILQEQVDMEKEIVLSEALEEFLL